MAKTTKRPTLKVTLLLHFWRRLSHGVDAHAFRLVVKLISQSLLRFWLGIETFRHIAAAIAASLRREDIDRRFECGSTFEPAHEKTAGRKLPAVNVAN